MRKWRRVAAEHVPEEHKRYKGAVKLHISAHFRRPMGHLKRHNQGLKTKAPTRHTQKPDADNIAKFVGDCLTGLAFHDDAQVDCLMVDKLWTNEDNERVEVELTYG